jgi:hypothetical protein
MYQLGARSFAMQGSSNDQYHTIEVRVTFRKTVGKEWAYNFMKGNNEVKSDMYTIITDVLNGRSESGMVRPCPDTRGEPPVRQNENTDSFYVVL